MKGLKIKEIFYSLQGEGYFTGVPAVFVRFSGCNLSCYFCDTQHEDGKLMREADIVSEIKKYPAKHVVITGGEPGLQLTDSFIEMLKKEGFFIQIETNGTFPLPEHIDWVTCSPKENSTIRISRIDELKVVYVNQHLSKYNAWHVKVRFLQPCSMENTDEVIRYVLEHPEWRLSLQTHKILQIE